VLILEKAEDYVEVKAAANRYAWWGNRRSAGLPPERTENTEEVVKAEEQKVLTNMAVNTDGLARLDV
jgi:hypothetical protein